MCLTVGRQSRDHRPLSHDPSVTFFKFFSNCLKRRKKRCLTVGRWSRDLRPLSRDRSATFSKIFPNCLKRPKNVVYTVSRPSRDLRQLSRDRSATFFKKISNCLNCLKNVVWQSADGRVTSDHCRVTVQRLFSKFSQFAWNVQKTLLDSQPTVAWPPTTVAWPFSDFFQNFSNCLKRLKNVVWHSADGRVTSDHCRVTVQRFFSKFSKIAWNVQKTLSDSRPMVAWPPTTLAWPFSDFLSIFRHICWNVDKICLKASEESFDLPAILLPWFLRTTYAYAS